MINQPNVISATKNQTKDQNTLSHSLIVVQVSQLQIDIIAQDNIDAAVQVPLLQSKKYARRLENVKRIEFQMAVAEQRGLPNAVMKLFANQYVQFHLLAHVTKKLAFMIKTSFSAVFALNQER